MSNFKVHVLQNSSRDILAVETSLKKMDNIHGDKFQLLSYQYMNRLSKKARDNDESSFSFTGKNGEEYTITIWEV